MSIRAQNRLTFQALEARRRVEAFGRVILVGSGKGGVGKSFVACAIAQLLADRRYRVGILDIDIHGASVPSILQVRPPLRSTKDGLEPKESNGVKVMSVALLTGDNPVPMRGNDKQELITQFLSLTDWGPLDYLVVDLPPSTGDELLSAFELFVGKSTLLLVTTPSPNAVGVVSRLSRLAKRERVPVAGIVLNMAYIERGRSGKTFPFGRIDRVRLEGALDSNVIAEIPLEPRLNDEGLLKVVRGRSATSVALRKLLDRLTVPDSG